MRRVHRIVLLAVLIGIAPVIAGCENFDNDKFDVFGLNTKKKLKGERKELFPEGVPGVTQGVPAEYLNKPEQSATAQAPGPLPMGTTANAPSAQAPGTSPMGTTGSAPADKSATLAQPGKTAAIESAPEPKPKAKPKRKPKPHVAARPAAKVTVQPAAQKPNNAQQQPAPWPGQNPAQSPWPAQGQSANTAPWPTAPPPGTFSR